MKPFKFGIIIGRFQLFHKGHENIINYGIELCDKLVIYIGSSQESNTAKNPFSYEYRKKVIEMIYGDKVIIKPLPDIGLGNNSSWGKYVLETAKRDFGEYPDLSISGKENRRQSWFDNLGVNISELLIAKEDIQVSSTYLKDRILNNDFEAWAEYTNSNIYCLYNEMRNIYLNSIYNQSTNSI